MGVSVSSWIKKSSNQSPGVYNGTFYDDGILCCWLIKMFTLGDFKGNIIRLWTFFFNNNVSVIYVFYIFEFVTLKQSVY